MGASALSSNTTGGANVATGNGSLASNTTGSNNTASGNGALNKTQQEILILLWEIMHCIGIPQAVGMLTFGLNSLFYNNAANNTALGFYAGDGITTGSNNVMVGYLSDPSAVDGTNQTVLGYEATGQADNSVTLGNDDVTAVYMAEDAGAIVYAAGLNLGGTAGSATAQMN